MHIDILIFAIIAAFLIYRLNSVLGTRNGNERERPNPFSGDDAARPVRNGLRPAPATSPRAAVPLAPVQRPLAPLAGFEQLVDSAANKDGRIERGLSEIAAADPMFEVNTFMGGAKFAFEMVVTAYARGDLDTLKPLLSDKLYKDFAGGIKARDALGHTSDITIHRIKQARIVEAHLGGTMAYITVDYDVDETMVTRDRDGKIVDGNPDSVFSVQDIWTFTRDSRSHDPNWMLIETRVADHPEAII